MRILFLNLPVLFLLFSPQLSHGQIEAKAGRAAGVAEAYDLSEPEGIHHRRVVPIVLTNGVALPVSSTNAGLVLLEHNLNYVDEAGQLRESNPTIEPSPEGAVVRGIGMNINFSADLDSAGAIEIRSPHNARLRGTPLGLSYYDPATGKSVLLAGIQSSRAKIIGPQKLLYEDIFDAVSADALYEVTKSGVMQTIVIKEKLPSPDDYGLSDETSRLEVITEFLDAAQPAQQEIKIREELDPVKRSRMVEPDFADSTLYFGDVFIPPGVAFALSTDLAADDPIRKHPVGKRWQEMPGEGRSVLFEAVEYSAAKGHLETLPAGTKSSELEPRAALERRIPTRRLATRFQVPAQVALSDYRPRGFALDWQVFSAPIGTLTFLSGNTYVISGPQNNPSPVSITHATFQRGCIIKYHPQASIRIMGSATFEGTTAEPSIKLGNTGR